MALKWFVFEKLKVSHTVKEFYVFSGIRRLITILTKAPILSQIKPVPIYTPHFWNQIHYIDPRYAMDNVQRNNGMASLITRTASGVLQSCKWQLGQLFQQLHATYSKCAVTNGQIDLPHRFLIPWGMSQMEWELGKGKHAMKISAGVEIQLHAFLASALDRDKQSLSFCCHLTVRKLTLNSLDRKMSMPKRTSG